MSALPESAPAPSVEAFCAAFRETNGTAQPGSQGSLWLRHERFAMARFPPSARHAPGPLELESVLWQAPAVLADYVTPPERGKAANAVTYLLEPADLPLNLPDSSRWAIRRAHRDLQFDFVDAPTVQQFGMDAYCETRARNGLSDGTAAQFGRFCRGLQALGRRMVGAWRDGSLVAFVSLFVVGDAVTIDGTFSCTATRCHRPNEGLAHAVVEYYLGGRRSSVVGYGLSSLQGQSAADSGLHHFKTKVGFRAEPVCRRFAVHPYARPLMMTQRGGLAALDTLLKVRPQSRQLRKAAGMLRQLIE